MQNDFFVFRSYEMIDDVRGGCITSGVAEPLGTDETLDDGCGRVDATVAVHRKIVK